MGTTACLALHGLGGGPYEMGPLIDALEADGFRVDAPILPGHEPKGPVMPASNWRDWATASEAAFDALVAAGAPVVVVGFSTRRDIFALASRHPPAGSQGWSCSTPFLAIRHSRPTLRPATLPPAVRQAHPQSARAARLPSVTL